MQLNLSQLRNAAPIVTISLLATLLAGIVLWPSVIHFVPPGHASVQWRRFGEGTDLVNYPGEGIVVTAPWNLLTTYDVRVQLQYVDIDVLMQDGLTIDVQLSVRYHLDPNQLGYLQRFVGSEYFDTLIRPVLAAEARNILALYTADTVYSANRRSLQTQIEKAVIKGVRLILKSDREGAKDIVNIDEVLFLTIKLPQKIAVAIERKNEERQRVEMLEYAIQAEDQERKRKIVEGNGIRSYHEIIRSSLSDEFLRWKSIDATLKLAMSPNSKVIALGGMGTSMPLMFNLGESAVPGSGADPTPPVQTGPKVH